MPEYGRWIVGDDIWAGSYSELGLALEHVRRRRSTRARGVGESIRAGIRVVGSLTIVGHGGRIAIALHCQHSGSVYYAMGTTEEKQTKTQLGLPRNVDLIECD